MCRYVPADVSPGAGVPRQTAAEVVVMAPHGSDREAYSAEKWDMPQPGTSFGPMNARTFPVSSAGGKQCPPRDAPAPGIRPPLTVGQRIPTY
jgi:hypothetical protein